MSDTTPDGTDHAAAIHERAYWIRSRYSGHKTLGEIATELDEHADALAAELAEAEAEIDRLSGMFTTIHRILDGLPADAGNT